VGRPRVRARAVALWRHSRIAGVSPLPVFFFTFALGSAALVDFTAGNIAVFEQRVLWTMLTAVDRDAEAAARTVPEDGDRISGETRAISAA